KLEKLYGTYITGIPKYIDNNGRLHTNFNQDVARTGRLSSSDPNCFHPNTEVLTRAGWTRFADYVFPTPIAQWDANGAVTFVAPTAYFKQDASRLVHLDNQHTHLRVTPDHRCLLRHRRTRELRVFAAKDYPEDWQQIHAGHYAGGTESLGKDMVRLL